MIGPDLERTVVAGSGSLGRRVAAAAVLGPVFIGAVVLGGPAFVAFTVLLAVLGVREFYGLAAHKGFGTRSMPGIVLTVSFPILFYAGVGPSAAVGVVTAGIIGIALGHVFDADGEAAIGSVAATIFGAFYVGLLFSHMVLIRELPALDPRMSYATGGWLLLAPVVLTWLNDSAAYFVGRRWGRRRLLARVSPAKSVEGALGALVLTVLSGWILGRALVPWTDLLDGYRGVGLGALVGVAAPAGDLIESAFKRDAGVKDASSMIPGHGGVLDRFDSLLVTVPLAYYYYLLIAW